MSGQGYTYPPTATALRQSANHGTSSAFSSSANPDEDWTQISDLAERRRIQNRIAQRNYRKKLKRRLEDLERRAGSASESPPQVHAQLRQAARKPNPPSYKSIANNGSNSRQKLSPRVTSNSQYTPPMQNDDDMLFSNSFDREGSHTPPLFAYHHSYPTPEQNIYPPYPNNSYRQTTTPHSNSYVEYLTPDPMTLPSMLHSTDSLKREPHSLSSLSHDDSLNAFSMSYAAMTGMDLQSSSHYEGSNPHTPPLSHSFEHSDQCSESGYARYPSTPMSMPPSPPEMHCL